MHYIATHIVNQVSQCSSWKWHKMLNCLYTASYTYISTWCLDSELSTGFMV